jgi:hypothetical protein
MATAAGSDSKVETGSWRENPHEISVFRINAAT